QQYGVDVIPSTFLIDENGVILARDLDVYDLEKKLNYLYYEQVKMYPKMVNTKLYFTNKTKYTILDNKGVVIMKDKGDEIDLTGLPQGEYTCKYDNRIEKFFKRTTSMPTITFYPVNVEDDVTLS